MPELVSDKLLNIHTNEVQMGFHKSLHHHRYEPTPYSALKELFQHYEINEQDRLVDFGCGKGRLNFYLHYFHHTPVTGIEMDEKLYHEALKNKENYVRKNRKKVEDIHFLCCLAEEYPIQPQDNIFYFFNPFSVQVFMKIINNILLSVEENRRKVDVILYYPSEDYLFYLENQTSFQLKQEIVLKERDAYEKFVVYQLNEIGV